jgi:repressor LexA
MEEFMTTRNRNLTSRQEEVLNYIREHLEEHGAPPTLREMGQALGIASPNGVKSLVEALVRKGYLQRREGVARGLSLTRDPLPSPGIVRIPILGRVAAGVPLLAEENREGYLQLDESFINSDETFALKVRGDSMVEAGILDGDTVVARMQPTARTGDIIVAVIDNEATVKFYFPGPDKIRLEPANPYYQPIEVDPRTTPFRVAGKVIALLRKMG